MTQNEPRLCPLSSQPFSEIRERDMIYVDKTGMMYEMTHGASNYIFLSRPRRFGKSLLVSTLKEYFEGRKELFQGLAIEKMEKEWTKHPVINMSMSLGKHMEKEQLECYLDNVMNWCERDNGMPTTEGAPNIRLTNLVKDLYAKTGQKVVILIDEYDAPLLDVMNEEENLPLLRKVMRNFYSPLKDLAPYLRFVFLTGITKFSQLSIFSELNNIRNITMDSKYAALCGITEEEMLAYLKPHIERLAENEGLTYDEAVERLKQTYDGYHFSWPSPDIYNPFSLFNAMESQKIDYYWFGSGTPTYLIEMLRKFGVNAEKIGGNWASSFDFDAPTEAMSSALPLLYQSGYITIKDGEEGFYLLDIPNREVRVGLMQSLLREYVTPARNNEGNITAMRLYMLIKKGKIEEALGLLKTFLSTVPYTENTDYEGHYQSMLYVILSIIGYSNVDIEVRTSTGRVDMVLKVSDTVYIFEFKLNGSAEEALAQIDIKDYPARFALYNLPIVKVGVNFSTETRTLTDWLIEK